MQEKKTRYLNILSFRINLAHIFVCKKGKSKEYAKNSKPKVGQINTVEIYSDNISAKKKNAQTFIQFI